MADIERWITINGVHIPIMKGEGKMQALGRFLKGKRATKKAQKDKKINDLTSKMEEKAKQLHDAEANSKYGSNRRVANLEAELDNMYMEREDLKNSGKQTIKGNIKRIAHKMSQMKEAAAYEAGKKMREGWDKQAEKYEREAAGLYDSADKEWQELRNKGDYYGARARQAKYEYDRTYAWSEAQKAKKYGDYEEASTYARYMNKPYKTKLSSNYKVQSNDIVSGKLTKTIDATIKDWGKTASRDGIAYDVYRKIRRDFPNVKVTDMGSGRIKVDNKLYRFSHKKDGWHMVETDY